MASGARQGSARTLRVFIDAPLDAQREHAWALYDPAGRMIEAGRSASTAWPTADRHEAVLGADAVRAVALALPPLPRDRQLAAATFALEERLATAPEDAVVALRPAADGRVLALVTSRELARSLSDAVPPFQRAIAEPELASVVDGWRWCESPDSAFVRTSDGGAFSVSSSVDGTLPPELEIALAQAGREQRAPARIVVDRIADAPTLQRWSSQTGVVFAAGTPWSWQAQARGAFSSATDLLGALAIAPTATASPGRSLLASAAAIAALALLLHVIAGIGTWLWQRFELARAERELLAIALQAGARNANASNAVVELASLYATARHRAGREAHTDAMPLFARAAPALAALPSGSLRTATWSAGAWTLELGAIDDATLSSLVARMRAAGLSSLHARTSSGVRVRLTLA